MTDREDAMREGTITGPQPESAEVQDRVLDDYIEKCVFNGGLQHLNDADVFRSIKKALGDHRASRTVAGEPRWPGDLKARLDAMELAQAEHRYHPGPSEDGTDKTGWHTFHGGPASYTLHACRSCVYDAREALRASVSPQPRLPSNVMPSLIGLLKAIADPRNDPNDGAADAVTAMMVWRREAADILAALSDSAPSEGK